MHTQNMPIYSDIKRKALSLDMSIPPNWIRSKLSHNFPEKEVGNSSPSSSRIVLVPPRWTRRESVFLLSRIPMWQQQVVEAQGQTSRQSSLRSISLVSAHQEERSPKAKSSDNTFVSLSPTPEVLISTNNLKSPLHFEMDSCYLNATCK